MKFLIIYNKVLKETFYVINNLMLIFLIENKVYITKIYFD